ncbi:hypothetical protein GCM10025862_25940 [Arsenicicoccus piscis]|uniref:Uncharacterized protein n=1 Tax=Arsenicicoccus piscis TaxID=673954 RepID=A0ABQ6HSB4_9MICO|nr:hypothetical protein GCM10025862_25940 [Arsenicicoccus piscis]
MDVDGVGLGRPRRAEHLRGEPREHGGSGLRTLDLDALAGREPLGVEVGSRRGVGATGVQEDHAMPIRGLGLRKRADGGEQSSAKRLGDVEDRSHGTFRGRGRGLAGSRVSDD